jgi:hypothetical protein
MSFIIRDYRCPEHGLFELLEERADVGDKPCPACGIASEFAISPVHGKVKAVETSRGGWQKPEHPGWLDTRELGEGMPLDEWQEKRRGMREEQRRKDLKELLE